FLKIFIAQMGTFDIWKNPRMSKVQHEVTPSCKTISCERIVPECTDATMLAAIIGTINPG
ncbi:hypothetical protein, partial [Ferrovum myxofaciens]|uniref:hypothetical protein n=1 Tax=Ferrovum myxofaciens TaxID=416213 RepID=UPI001D0CE738